MTFGNLIYVNILLYKSVSPCMVEMSHENRRDNCIAEITNNSEYNPEPMRSEILTIAVCP